MRMCNAAVRGFNPALVPRRSDETVLSPAWLACHSANAGTFAGHRPASQPLPHYHCCPIRRRPYARDGSDPRHT